MDRNDGPKKMKWRHSMLCCLPSRQHKGDLAVESPHLSRRNTAIAAFAEHDYRTQPQYLDQHPYHLQQYAGVNKVHNFKPRTVARPISTKRTSSASTGHSAETRSTHCDSTESPKAQSRTSSQRARLNQASEQGSLKKLPSRAFMKKKQVTPGRNSRGAPDYKNNMYVNIKHDNETITELSTPDMYYEEDESAYEEDSRLSNGYASRSTDFRSFRTSSDYSDINGFTTYQPDGVLEATILRSDSDSTRDMSVLGAEAHVTVYNLSQRMSYDLREAGRNIGTIATQVAHACMVNPKLIKK